MKAKSYSQVALFVAVSVVHAFFAYLLLHSGGDRGPSSPAPAISTLGVTVSLPPDVCARPFNESYQRGQAAAELDLASNKLKVKLILGGGPFPPSENYVKRTKYAAKLFGLQGVSAEFVATSCFPTPCDELAYSTGYWDRMERALEKKLGQDFRGKVEARAQRKFGAD